MTRSGNGSVARGRRLGRAGRASLRGALAALALAACGAPLIGGECADGFVASEGQCVPDTTADEGGGGASLGAPTCTENADCSASQICLHGHCSAVGECLIDAHCGCAAPTCVDQVCEGASVCTDSAPNPCMITADCGAPLHCVAGLCQFAVDCLTQAECPVNHACFHDTCWAL